MSMAALRRRRRIVVAATDIEDGGGGETPPPEGAIAAAIKRYDGGSGAAWFRGWISFPKTGDWAVSDASDLANKRILVNGEEPASGIYIALNDGRHGNGNYKTARVEFQASCDSDETIVCSVDLNARTVADRDTPQDTVEFTPRSWQLAPTLFGITDASHNVAADTAPMPIVRLDDPRIPAAALEFITTTFDLWADTATAGTAQYDENYPLIIRGLSAGDLDQIAEGIQRNASNNTPTVRQAIAWNYYVAGENPSWAGVDLNPSNYPAGNADSSGVAAEPYDCSLTNFMVYQLTGWEYSKIHIERNATAWLSDYQETQVFDPNGNTFGYPRQNYRRVLQQGVLGAILRMNRYIDCGSGNAFKSPTDAWGTASVSMATRVQNRISRLKAVAEGYTSPAEIPAWWNSVRIWGVGKDEVNGTDVVPAPNFQFSLAGPFWMAYRHGIDTRDEIPALLDTIADWVIGQAVNVGNATNGYAIFATPYEVQNPAALSPGENGIYTTDNAWLFAWKFARTGDAAARALFDHVFDARHLKYALDQDETKTRKILGEIFFMMMHAVALRCGIDPLTGE